jgi:guanine nucleotide-binding protein alpha-1 subunit
VRSVNVIIDILSETMDNARLLSSSESDSSQKQLTPLSESHRNAIRRLGVLRQIERDLKSFLGSGASEVEDAAADNEQQESNPRTHEFAVRSNSGWKSILAKVRNPMVGKEHNTQRKAAQVIASCGEDIAWIWKDPATQYVLKNRQSKLEDTPGL